MLSNRVMRLITSVLILLGVGIVVVAIIAPIFDGGNSSGVASSGMFGNMLMSFGVCLIHQICWDLLNFSFLENVVGRTIKRILFIAVLAFAALMGCMLYFDNVLNNNHSLREFTNAGAFAQGMTIASALAPVSAAIFCLLADRMCWEREYAPFLPLYSMGAALAAGLVIAFLGESMWVAAPIVLMIGGLVFFVGYCVVKKTFIYGEEEYEYVRSGSSGYSGGYSGYSGGSSSGYSGYSDTPQDNRKSDGIFLNQFEIGMYRIADSHSRTTSLSHGAYLSCSVYSSTYPGGVDFKITGTVTVYTDYLTHQADVSDIRSDVQREISDIARSLKSDAESEIRSLRDQYTDYDGRMSISVSSDVRFEQR
ncbi:MAG: hypothetical protein IJF39_05450 [Clostridia bacterium]|nr:hypothetical protein [Clostridia bacterium]